MQLDGNLNNRPHTFTNYGRKKKPRASLESASGISLFHTLSHTSFWKEKKLRHNHKNDTQEWHRWKNHDSRMSREKFRQLQQDSETPLVLGWEQQVSFDCHDALWHEPHLASLFSQGVSFLEPSSSRQQLETRGMENNSISTPQKRLWSEFFMLY